MYDMYPYHSRPIGTQRRNIYEAVCPLVLSYAQLIICPSSVILNSVFVSDFIFTLFFIKLLTLVAVLTCSWFIFLSSFHVTLFYIHKLDIFQ